MDKSEIRDVALEFMRELYDGANDVRLFQAKRDRSEACKYCGMHADPLIPLLEQILADVKEGGAWWEKWEKYYPGLEGSSPANCVRAASVFQSIMGDYGLTVRRKTDA